MMGNNIGKSASSKDGSEKTELSSNFNQQPDDVSTGGECAPSAPVNKQMLPLTPSFDVPGPLEPCIMVVLYDFTATLDSQLTVKRGEIVRLLGYSPAGDWSEVEASSRLPCRTPRVAWAGVGGWVRGWVPTSYLTEHVRPAQLSEVSSGAADWRRIGDEDEVTSTAVAYPWYHGAVSRQAAEQLLRSGITGSYLVRESESAPGQLSVTVRHLGRVYHYRISRDSCGWHFITETHRFPTVVQLIYHHSQAADGLICPLLYPAARREQPCLLRGGGGMEARGAALGLDDWEIDRSEIIMRNKLGWGQYGDVYEALWRRYNSIVAVKTLKRDVDQNLNDFLAEASIMKNLQHKNLLRLLGVCTREPPYYIVTEYMPHGNLLNYLRQRSSSELTPPVLLYMAVQIASGMAYLEANNFIHRDLAARNCLVGDQHTIKVADFGLARYMQLHEDTYTARNGAKFPIKWTAPEGLAYFRFSSKSDVWAFGVVLWELATYGFYPYPGVELHGVYQLLERGYRMERPHGCPESVYSIMLRCWSWEAADRPTFAEIKAELEEMWRTIDMTEAVAQELAIQTAPTQSMDRMQLASNVAPAVNVGVDNGGEALMPSMPMPMLARMAPHQHVEGGGACDGAPSSSSHSTSCTSSATCSSSSPGAAETDGQEGDDEGEGDLRLQSTVDKGLPPSTVNWNATRTSDGLYQGDYVVSGGGGGGGGGDGVTKVAPASDLPLPTHKITTRDSQLSAPASLPPLHHHHHQQPRQHQHNGSGNHNHHHHRHYQQQLQFSESGRSVPKRRSGSSHLVKHLDEGSLRCPVRPKEKNITPAESGVGESIVSGDSPGGDSNARQQDEGMAMAPPRGNHKTAVMAAAVEANNFCVTPTKDIMSDGTSDDRRMRLDAESMTQFTTLPAQDRITRYLESLGELGDAPEERTQRGKGGGPRPPHPPNLSHFPPPPPVPPPPQPSQHLRNCRILSSERRRNVVGRSASCYQTVSSTQLPPPSSTITTSAANGSVRMQEDIPAHSTPSPRSGEAATLTDDVYQAPNLSQNNRSNGEDDREEASTALSSEVGQAELTACLNSLSLEATELSTSCPRFASELSALSQQLSVCRGQIEARLHASANGVGGTAEEDHCLAGIAQALRHIKQALAGMRAQVEEEEEEEAPIPTPAPPPSPPPSAAIATNATITTDST